MHPYKSGCGFSVNRKSKGTASSVAVPLYMCRYFVVAGEAVESASYRGTVYISLLPAYNRLVLHNSSNARIHYHSADPRLGLYNKTFLCYNSRGNKKHYDLTKKDGFQ